MIMYSSAQTYVTTNNHLDNLQFYILGATKRDDDEELNENPIILIGFVVRDTF